ncbi:hypothetical protein TWF696_000825 [Orbilia brochopaga]|uniref:DNA-directed RNA polymerase III RPC4 n=1 Tax=Orbilia brochopaga TaxID=3140254 RepID=A0AAV9VCH3_9PEZI
MPPRARGRPARSTRAAAASADVESQGQAQASAAAAAADEAVESTPLAIPPPSGRLEGLANVPAGRSAAAAAAGTAGSPPLLNPGERPRPKLKFAPKNTARKTKEEREQLNRMYNPAPADDSLSAFGVTRGGPSGKGARGRGRGRGGRPDGRREEVAIASGPFALGSVMTGGGKQKVSIERMSRSLRTSGRSGSSRVKREGDDSGLVKEEYSSSDDSEGGPKVDVEMIDLITSSEGEGGDDEEVDTKDRKPSGRGFAPVRIERHEHVDRTAQAGDVKKKGDAAAAGKKDKGKGKEKEVEITEERKTRGRRASGTGPRVKIESESPKATRRSTRSPEQVRKKQQSSSPEDKRRKPKARSQSRNRKTGIVPQSQEDVDENDRYDVDRFSMLHELGPALPERKPVDAEGDHEMGESSSAVQVPHDEKENKLYLFQFPPVLPVLEPVAAVEDAAEVTIKEENPTTATAAGATAAGSSTAAAAQTAGDSSATGASTARTADARASKPRFATLEEVQRAKVPPGTAGKLQVHRSGKVTILFGGIEFEVHRGVDCDFLQDVVVLQQESGAMDERGRPKGRAWGMGQLKGKFVATPDIGKLV